MKRSGVAIGLCLVLLLSARTPAASQDQSVLDPYPLRPADTTSPRATLQSFQENVREVVRRVRARLPPAEVDRAVSRVLDTMDLRGLPPSDRLDQGAEHAALLLEILSRVEVPPLVEIPDLAAVEAGNLDRWTLLDTRITIARTGDGPHAGEFQFTRDTVLQLPAFYESARSLAPRPGTLAGFYDEWSHMPGPWVPSGWTANLPAFAYRVIWHQTVWQWVAAFTIVGLALAVILFAYRLARRLDRPSGDDLDQRYLARLVATVGAIALLEFAIRSLDDAVNLTGQRLFLVNGALRAGMFGAIGLAIILGLNALGASIIRLRDSHPGSIDAHLIRVVVRLLAILTVIALAVWGADSFGLPAAPLLTSIGIGGLAIALAIRPTLENVIGGFILFADKPVRVGDFCRYGDDIGTVEEIGLRSTLIRSLERTAVTVPNAEFSQMKLENFERRDLRLLNTVLRLRYETTPEQMRWILAKLRELLLGHPMVVPVPARVRFVDVGAYAKEVGIFAYLRCQDESTFLAVKEDILLRAEDIVREGGSGFAVPSQTTYISQYEGIDEARRDMAERQVSRWRVQGRLPFPEFEQHDRERLRDVLDYPPKGSPDYQEHPSALEPAGNKTTAPFTAKDLVGLPSIAAILRTRTPVAEYLLSQFSAATRELLSNYRGGADADLAEALARDLNAVVCGPPLYEKERFNTVSLSSDTKAWLDRAPEDQDLQRVNRLLLNDAFLSELSRR